MEAAGKEQEIKVIQSKKIFTRMCLNNWGGITHKVLKFHEYVNLFSGKSGSGKSTVMDAIQVILYGSFSPNFLNRAADDSKNKRSVLSYLRGEQKDGSANREGQDFCSTIVLEIEDTGTHNVVCIGMAFEVRKAETGLKKYVIFSHSGKMPESCYLSEEGCPYTNAQIRKLVEERAQSDDNRGRVDVNRIYPSHEAYLSTLYDSILGYIDGARFCTMEKSAIALKMTNGTGQFIRDYMFPKNTGSTIERISEQLGAYRDIKDKIDDVRRRIELLTTVQDYGQELTRIRADIETNRCMLNYIDIADLTTKIEAGRDELERLQRKMEELSKMQTGLREEADEVEKKLRQVLVDREASALGNKEKQLEELMKRSQMLENDSRQWRKVIAGLRRWGEDEVVLDYISNPVLQMIETFCRGEITAEQCRELHQRIKKEKKNIEEEYDNYREKLRDTEKELNEKKRLADDMKHNRKSYSDRLRDARKFLEARLQAKKGKSARVFVLADLFDVKDRDWKDAVEGRMGRLKFSLITEPQYAHEAAELFRRMKNFREIDLIDSEAICKSPSRVRENSLYETVETGEEYVDICLRHYLGGIIKCSSVEELRAARNGVTTDCYSYSNYIFRHLKEKDYTTFACIGRKVSKARLAEYEEDAARLQKEYAELAGIRERLKAAAGFEELDEDENYLIQLSKAQKELEAVLEQRRELEQAILTLREGKYRELERQEKELTEQKEKLEKQRTENQNNIYAVNQNYGRVKSDVSNRQRELEEKSLGYTANPEIEELVQQELKRYSGMTLKSRKNTNISKLEEEEQQKREDLVSARMRYIREYPACSFNGQERTNEEYEKQLQKYCNEYEPKYQQEFEKQCSFIYKSLKENVIATIHGDIKAARRHMRDINRMLRETNFSDSTYQIKIEPAKNENGQFYDMLMAEELDSKNPDNEGFEGQLSLGEDVFYQRYEQKIKLLTDKFMPPRSGDERQMEKSRQEMEKYADYRNYLSFAMYEQVTDEQGNVIRENYVDEMAGRDSGGEGQNPKYVALLAGFAMLYMQQNNRDSKIKLVLLDEAFSKMDQERSAVCLSYARKMNLQLIVCVPDERLQSLIQNVDCVYGFRRHQNQISMMYIDKGDYLKLMEGEEI